ncbi:MAG: hypothetical protein EPO22_05980 [Dehalococcoidia bacterium]|nr:MAG: hypothetical protein EPO22_05980 [Dehalococcoidia bacterium]
MAPVTGDPISISNASLYSPQAWSPDGARLALTCEVKIADPRASDVCVADLSGAEPRILTDDGDVIGAAFSPDGTSIAYLANRDAETGTFTLKVLRVATCETTTIASGVMIGGFSFLAGSG